MIRCKRCGLSIRTATPICPGCGVTLDISDEEKAEKDYYALFELSPHLSHSEISTRLREAARFWTRRANNAPQIEQRHEAELMLQCLAEAEARLLEPVKRRAYDEALRNQQNKENPNTTPPSSSARGESQQVPLTACPRCGLRQSVTSSFCPACGFEFSNATTTPQKRSRADRRGSTASQTVVPSSPFPRPTRTGDREPTSQETLPPYSSPSNNEFTEKQHSGFFGFFGWRKLTGTVIAVEAPYMAKSETDWLRILFKFAIGIILLPIILGAVIAALIIGITFSILGIGASRFFSSLASQIIGFFLVGKLFGPKEQVPVRDIRLRNDSGLEHLVRIRGELVAGNMNVGDEVEVEGFNRRGTLMLRRGKNLRTRSEIRVKRR